MDENTGIQAKSRKHATRSARPGSPARREFEYVRHGTVSLMAAMNVATGQVHPRIITRNDSATSIEFLTELDQAIPKQLAIHLVMDNGSQPHLQGHPRLASQTPTVPGDLHPETRLVA